MGLLDSLGSTLGGILGNMVLPGIGGIIGEELGQVAGGMLSKVFDEFSKDPAGTMANPQSLPSQFVDNALNQLGAPKQFRSLVQFANDPQSAIKNILAGLDRCDTRPVAKGGSQCPDQGLTTNGKDCVDTGRYLISAHEGEVKIYDKQTKTWVECQGDPHLSTSDGDHGQFQKNLTIDLPDGSEVKIKTTPQDANGVAYIDQVAVLKGDEAVVMSGFHDGKDGVNVGHVLNNADSVANQWSDGTVLRAGRNVSDLTYASDGKEILGGDPNGKWGEWSLDNHGGKARYGDNGGPHFPFHIDPGVLKAIANAVKTVGGGSTVGDAVKAAGDAVTTAVNGGGRGDAGILDAVDGLSNRVSSLEDKLSKLDPNSPTYAADSLKLQTQIQQAEQQMTELSTMLTNISKNKHDAVENFARNLA